MPNSAPEPTPSAPGLARSRNRPGVDAPGGDATARSGRRVRPLRVLLCGRASGIEASLPVATAASRPLEILHADTAERARTLLAETAPGDRFDLAILDAAAPGGSGLSLALEAASTRHRPGLVLLADPDRPVSASDATRAGLLDLLEGDPSAPGTAERVGLALRRVERDRRQRAARQRARREQRRLARRCSALEARCTEVERERRVISDQVETLCGDLVSAYQELADRLDAAVSPAAAPTAAACDPGDLATRLEGELDLEPLIRTTLEHLVEAAGPTNAAVFLPASADEYSLGGYVNHTCTNESAGMLLEHLADVVAPKLACAAAPVHLTDNRQLAAWFDEDAAWLDDSEFVGVPCILGDDHDEEPECLAVVVLFRDGDQAFGAAALEACEALGPVLAAALHRVIRVHHRTGFATTGDADGDAPE